jgi:hypothetical protein
MLYNNVRLFEQIRIKLHFQILNEARLSFLIPSIVRAKKSNEGKKTCFLAVKSEENKGGEFILHL